MIPPTLAFAPAVDVLAGAAAPLPLGGVGPCLISAPPDAAGLHSLWYGVPFTVTPAPAIFSPHPAHSGANACT